MKKLLAIIILASALSSCTEPVLEKGDYVVIDTLNVSKNGFGMILGYDVLIRVDSTVFSAYVNDDGDLLSLNRKLKSKR